MTPSRSRGVSVRVSGNLLLSAHGGPLASTASISATGGDAQTSNGGAGGMLSVESGTGLGWVMSWMPAQGIAFSGDVALDAGSGTNGNVGGNATFTLDAKDASDIVEIALYGYTDLVLDGGVVHYADISAVGGAGGSGAGGAGGFALFWTEGTRGGGGTAEIVRNAGSIDVGGGMAPAEDRPATSSGSGSTAPRTAATSRRSAVTPRPWAGSGGSCSSQPVRRDGERPDRHRRERWHGFHGGCRRDGPQRRDERQRGLVTGGARRNPGSGIRPRPCADAERGSREDERPCALVESADARLWFTLPGSLDFDPIELAWSELDAFLMAASACSVGALNNAVDTGVALFAPRDARAGSRHCGFRRAA